MTGHIPYAVVGDAEHIWRAFNFNSHHHADDGMAHNGLELHEFKEAMDKEIDDKVYCGLSTFLSQQYYTFVSLY